MSTSKTKTSGSKVKELTKVISIQEKTIQRLQKVKASIQFIIRGFREG